MTDPQHPDQGMPDRAEQAFRSALDELPPDAGVDPARARRTVSSHRNTRLTVAAVATVFVLLAGVLGVPRLLADPVVEVAAPASATPSPAAEKPTDPAPAGWRTEYYRSISFSVPSSWGYAYEPGSAWCAGAAEDPTPAPEQRTPYVSLGGPSVVATIACPELPESLLTEHVATTPRYQGDGAVSGTTRRGDWLLVTQALPDTVLVVTTKDQALADRIVGSAGPAADDTPCAPSSPVTGELGARPQPGVALAEVTGVQAVSVCQYDPDGEPEPSARLRAHRPLAGPAARTLVERLVAAPVNRPACADGPTEIAAVVRIWADSGPHEVYVQASGCDSSTPSMAGGIADGQSLRQLTRSACQALLVPPITLEAASGTVAENCLG